MKRFDRFCYKYEKYGVKNLMLIVIMGQIAMFLLMVTGVEGLYELLAFRPDLILQGQVWRVLTFVFLPSSTNIINFFFFCILYYWFGRTLEAHWGKMKFTIYYLSGTLMTLGACMLAAPLISAHAASLFQMDAPASQIVGGMVSNEYVNMTVFLAFATLCPEEQIRIFFLIPVKLKWLAVIELGLITLSVLAQMVPYGLFIGRDALLIIIAPMMALVNYFIFFKLDLYYAFRGSPAYRTGRNPRGRVTAFKKGVRDVARQKGYIHKCAVCGVTDAGRPDMEFRYCSLCQGYQCYCSEHIFQHEHK